MKGKHPKRRKDKYNPYSIWEMDKHYYISFTDGQGNFHEMEISRVLYEVFDTFELIELSYLNEWDRHIEQSEVWESTLNVRAMHKPESVEDMIIQKYDKGRLYIAIGRLPRKQKRRLLMNYFGGLSCAEIAKRENCSIRAVEYSVHDAIRKLKEILENY